MSTRTVQTKWYRFWQNNSGGRMKPPAVVVYVEALDPKHANARAKDIGLYFDGEGDCSCCGDRWHTADVSDEQGEEPTEEVLRFGSFGTDKVPEAVKLRLGESVPVVLPTRKVKP